MKNHELESKMAAEAGSLLRRHQSSVRRMLTGLALASGLTAGSWALGISPVAWMHTSASAATKSKPAKASQDAKADDPKSDKSSNAETEETTVKLNYYSASWPRVFQDIAETGDLEVIADKVPRGRFSRMDKAEHSRKEAMRIVNKELEQQGLRLIQKGQFLILIETTLSRPNYAPAVLPAKTQPKPLPEEPDETVGSTGFRAESMTRPRDSSVDRAVYSQDVSEKSLRYSATKNRQPESEAPRERTQAARNAASSRSVRQTAHEEPERDVPAAASRKPHPIESAIPTMLADVGAPAPAVVYRARQLSAVELSKKVYRALKSSAELVDSGRNGLPAISIVAPQFKSAEGPNGKAVAAHSVEFMISIDERRNELLIDGTDKDVSAATKLLRVIDRVDDPNLKTQIKTTTKYACEIADQLPAEIERIRAARGSDARRPVERKPASLADQRQRRDVRGLDPEADAPLPDEQIQIPDGVLGNVLGNFKGEINIEVIEDLNAIIVTGNERDVEQIIKVIKQIEQLSEATAPQVHLLHLKNVDSESLAELLTSVYEKLVKFPGGATRPRQNVAIIPVTKPNSLLIVAPTADLESILDLADELDKPVDPQTEFQVFQLKSAVAADVETLITEFYKERKSLGAKALVIADPRSNSLIVRAQARDLDEIKALISKVDRDNVGATTQMRIFRLKNAVATELSAVINAAIQSVLSPPTAQSGGGGGGQGQQGLGGGQVDEQFKATKSTVLKFLTVEKGESRQLKSGILSDIRITPDSHANSLVVTASDKSMDLIAALIQTLDRPTNTVSEIKVFTLENADANQMVQQLNALFNNQQQGGGTGGQLRQQLGIAFANADDASSSLVPMKFSVDTRTNSVIAVGSADALRVVEAILLRLDESNLRSRKNMVVRLNNAPAALIATAITQFFQQQRDLSQVDPNLVSSVEQLEREVIVIPDTVSNNLLVSSTPRYFPDILAMIKKLDARPKQVVIQALIVEVQLNNIDEFGIELGLQSPILFDRSLKQPPVVLTTTATAVTGLQTTSQSILSIEGTPGFNFNNPGVPLGNNVNSSGETTSQPGNVGGQALSNFSLGRSNSQLGYGGLVLSAGSNSVNALLRALASRTKIQILSRPQIRALDSQQAEVFVGQTIPTVTSFQTNATTGVISPTLQQRDTGIGMQVTPRINQDGDIVINMYAFRSQLSQQSVNVTTDSRGQPVGQRITDLSNVRSTVLVPANSTIVIGGMISTRDETTVRKAPFLGDLPVLGQLFRYDSRSALRTELLIFLTPRIVDGPEEEECLKEIEMSRIHFIESEAEEAHGPLRAVPAEQLFEDEPAPWINPGVPPSPNMTPLDPPSPSSSPGTSPPPTPTRLPPTPPTEVPSNVPPSPPLPDPNLTRINALRAMATEQDESASEGVSTANWTSQPASKKKSVIPKRIGDKSK